MVLDGAKERKLTVSDREAHPHRRSHSESLALAFYTKEYLCKVYQSGSAQVPSGWLQGAE